MEPATSERIARVTVYVLVDTTVEVLQRLLDHLPKNCRITTVKQDAPGTPVVALTFWFKNNPADVSTLELRAWVLTHAGPALPFVYLGRLANQLPLTISYAHEEAGPEWLIGPHNVPSKGVTLEEAIDRVGRKVVNLYYPVFVVDLTNRGTVSGREMLEIRYLSSISRATTRSSTKAASGRRPSRVSKWNEFGAAAAACFVPAVAPVHRTRYNPPYSDIRRVVGLESTIESLLDCEQFMVLENMYSAAFSALGSLSDHRYSELSGVERKTWDEVVQNNISAKVIIQANGYACANRLKYSIISNQMSWWFLQRPENDITSVSVAGPFGTESPASFPAAPVRATLGQIRLGGKSGSRRPYSRPTLPTKPDLRKSAIAILRSGDTIAFTKLDWLPPLRVHYTEHSTVMETVLFPGTSHSLEVALKHIDYEKVESDVVSQMETELDVYTQLADLQGSLIPLLRAYGSIEGGTFLYLGTEYIKGHTLTSADRHLGSQILHAFQTLHATGWVHGDVAPRNVIVAEEDNRRIVLIDLGMASPANTASATLEINAVNQMLSRL
ncbi:uncharacterized protein EV422DRAFT_621523 [Fimicolochytrium jonesii]|uniref:uncharacterized protein n=1 Tax=Fimicolochytrium jonesii TaxID=1396493 RepID=UPI0022FF1066|nr:uncharacterized protein EV422DRAFT_621523 [Fimicolochytrium jonesii]KAI8819053.1 hypothetical protein EV422DRAFT_621523 [Fimicolochytrium jonesii]